MVMRALGRVFALVSSFLFSCLLLAETQLSVSVDKTKLYENELLNLTVQANTAIDFSISGLMSFGGSQVELPEFEGLEDTWEVIDRQQGYNMQSINGKSQSTITWRYTLSPKTPGTLTVPSASFKDARSEAVEIEVLAGNRPRDAANPPTVFLKASVDKTAPYIQEQVIYTLQLFTLGEARGDMSEPTHPDVIIEPVGETTKTYKMAFNRRYEVYERKYVLFPQKSGPLSIDPQVFTGNIVDNRLRQRARARELSNTVDLEVKAPPSGYSGASWLPATSLFLNDAFEPDVSTIKQGDSITRKLNITALGLLGSALPELNIASVDGFKVYPDQPQVNSGSHIEGIQSLREQTLAYVAVNSGEVTLPAVSVTWWDTVNDVERIATVPERKITITPNNANTSPTNKDGLSATDDTLNARNQDAQLSAGEDASNARPPHTSAEKDDTQAVLKKDELMRDDGVVWAWIAAGILLAWALHALWLYKRLSLTKRNNQGSDTDIHDRAPTADASKLVNAIKQNDQNLSLIARQWLAAAARLGQISGRRFEYVHPELQGLLNKLEADHYQASNDKTGADLEATKARAIEIINAFSVSAQGRSNKPDEYALKKFN